MRSDYAHIRKFMAPPPHFDPEAPKEPTNVALNQDLVRAAKAHGINVSRIAEAVARYNDRVRTRGAFSDALRRF